MVNHSMELSKKSICAWILFMSIIQAQGLPVSGFGERPENSIGEERRGRRAIRRDKSDAWSILNLPKYWACLTHRAVRRLEKDGLINVEQVVADGGPSWWQNRPLGMNSSPKLRSKRYVNLAILTKSSPFWKNMPKELILLRHLVTWARNGQCRWLWAWSLPESAMPNETYSTAEKEEVGMHDPDIEPRAFTWRGM